MAVYLLKQAELVRIADQIDEVFKADWDFCGSLENALRLAGFSPHDAVPGAYRVFRRLGNDLEKRKALPDIAYVWILDELCSMDIVLATDSLPDYLVMRQMMEPVVRRAREIEEEVAASLQQQEHAV